MDSGEGVLDAAACAVLAAVRAVRRMNPSLARAHTRLGELAVAFAGALGLSEFETACLRWGVEIHDVGMVAIPSHILDKRGPLTRAERALVQQYPTWGYRLLSDLPVPDLIRDIVLCHREQWDGTGYPEGRRGEAIPYLARAASLVHAYDAMTTPREFGPALSPGRALEVVRRGAGTQFDPVLTALFVDVPKNLLNDERAFR
jgi:HD-GYP domain-containing protein (c-di-GMP phosphodiesterase class II)